MDLRPLGRTGLQVSALGFGCGNVGGLMVRGTVAERERAVARALELGITYFDTAPSYGDGLSEQHLGAAVKALGATVQVGTKFRIAPSDRSDVPGAITRSLDTSLRRLRLEHVDLLQLHNTVGEPGGLTVREVLDEVAPALERLRRDGKTRFVGITALGAASALHEVVAAGAFDTAQVCYNLLNPSAGHPLPAGFPAPDFRLLLARCRERMMGVIGIRALAAGALSGTPTRHPVAVPTVAPIASGPDYGTDVTRAQKLWPLIEDGYASDLVEASLRFVITSAAVSTVLLGYSSLEHLEHAAAAVAKGPLPPPAIERLRSLWQKM
jgi:L-galactose dehydrogenase/L-glyceraldehyde 3-phosphate reductase